VSLDVSEKLTILNDNSSTSKINVASPGIFGGAPFLPLKSSHSSAVRDLKTDVRSKSSRYHKHNQLEL